MGNVTLEHVSKHYDDTTAVDDMSLDIDDGEFIYPASPSGCGKSTTTEMIAGLIIPPEEKMFTGDHEVTNLPPKDRGVTTVFRNIALFPHMNVYDNIPFGLRLRDYNKEGIEYRIKHAAEVVQFQGMLERMPNEMSGGQRQRVTITRAIVRNPGAFPMDEPLVNLDTKLRIHMRAELQHPHRKPDTTIIYVTYDQAEVMTILGRIMAINSGQLQQIDPLLVCYNEPVSLFVTDFTGSPSMNFPDGEVAADGFLSTNIDVEFDPTNLGAESGADVTTGIRPEDVYLADEESLISNPSHHIDAATDVLEPMSDEIFVYLKLSESAETDLGGMSDVASSQLLMSVAPGTNVAEDEDVTVVLDRSRAHLFDTAMGKTISHGIKTPVQTSGASGTEAENDDRCGRSVARSGGSRVRRHPAPSSHSPHNTHRTDPQYTHPHNG